MKFLVGKYERHTARIENSKEREREKMYIRKRPILPSKESGASRTKRRRGGRNRQRERERRDPCSLLSNSNSREAKGLWAAVHSTACSLSLYLSIAAILSLFALSTSYVRDGGGRNTESSSTLFVNRRESYFSLHH